MGKTINIQVSHGASISQHDTKSDAVLEQADYALHSARINHNQFYISSGFNS